MRYLLCLIVALMICLPAPDVRAQGLGPLVTQDQAPTTQAEEKIEQIIRKAAENGVGVVVIDSDGNLLNQPATEPPDAAADEEMASSPLMAAQERATHLRAALAERLLRLPDAFNEVVYILRAASPDGTIRAFGRILLLCLALFAVGALFERYVFGRRIMRGYVTARVRDNPRGYVEKMPFLVMRFAVGVVGILVSMLVAYVLGFIIFGTQDDTAVQFTVALINIGYFMCRLVAGIWRMILSPFLSQYRIPHFSDRDAKRLHRWLWMLAILDVCTILFGIWIAELGLNYEVYAFLSAMMSAGIVLMNILMVLINRRAISLALRNGKSLAECSLLVRFLSRAWAPGMIVYVIFAWLELTADLVLGTPSSIPLIAGAYGITMSIIVVYGVINYLIERNFARARAIRRMNERLAQEESQEADLIAAEKAHDLNADENVARLEGDLAETRAAVAEEEQRLSHMQYQHLNSFEALAGRVAGILAFVAGTYAFFYIWDNDGARMVESYADRFLDILTIIFIGYIVYHAFRIWIDNKIAEETGDEQDVELGDEGGGSSASRLATLLPLFRNFILILVVVTLLLIVLMQMGINVGPLFAGAGIVGVAIGFGSQALVRDIFAGAFFLFDDAFRKGEYLDVGDVKGTVEKISVRSFQLRHHLGALHTIPFGELQVITNYSRDWVMMKLPLRVTYDTDVEKVRKLIKKLGQDLLEDPVIGDNFIQPLKSQGVIEMQDSAMIIRVKFMTKPGDQWLVRKKVYEEIRALFEREGIKFAHREVTVRLADGKVEDLSEADRKAVTAAVQAHIEEEEEAGAGGGAGDDR
ncbi:Moderate conductance mechanosensitive channel YbiO precursor [Sulfitobacter sp. THAF37]|uniref:mechanosensitive ion channel domain-containing protein n=1 Tax=Sulfitobacter sp. THAF37 TaxID=2587855 RepID=UPI0012682FBF|nr:mechanosensitive ion channel domain-containing protein [Sulfitobacter sp. THAF37]QFT58801.1 Moderate conductance mechanosensitive channel YbiO precursor [Sulfitobacter sp. THAF37]